MTDARDVIARAISTACGEYEDVPVGFEYWGMTDDLLAALAAAGLTITETPDEWEWGREAPYDWTDVTEWGDGPESQGNAEADYEANGGKLVRRRPAGPWEVAS